MEEVIKEDSELLTYLLNKFNKLSKNSVKHLLTNKQIVVNDKIVTKYNYLLKVGDKISFNGKKETTSKRFQPFRTSSNIACKSIIAGNTRISIVRARQKGLR